MTSRLSAVRRLTLAVALIATAACDSKDGTATPEQRPGAAAPKPAQRGPDWTATVVATPEGGFRMGNPKAKVQLVEFGSFTCSHCHDFHVAAHGFIDEQVRTGRLSYEYRPFMLNPQDMAAVLMATCDAPSRFFVWTNELYVHRDSWIEPFIQLKPADLEPLKALPPDQQLKGLAMAGGMHNFARVRGLPQGRFEQCLTDTPKLEGYIERQQAAVTRYQINGTPTFLINGTKVDGVANWEGLRPRLAAALE
jgi:protein-disulfide isomerase